MVRGDREHEGFQPRSQRASVLVVRLVSFGMPLSVETLSTWASLKDAHKGADILALGLGPSLKNLHLYSPDITVGVNDIWSRHETDYLCIGDSIRPGLTPFTAERLATIKASRPRALFHVNRDDPEHDSPMVLLETKGWTAEPDLDELRAGIIPCGYTSVWIAVIVAWHLGAKRIGVLGMDITKDHGLYWHLHEIECCFRGLASALGKDGCGLAQLSWESLVEL